MKSKHDSSSDSRDTGSNGANKNDDSMSDGGDRSRSRTRSRSRSASPSSKKDRSSKDKVDHDALSIYIGNVDYSATEEELRNAFIGCGDIVRVTIIKNMKTGHPKGAAFIEFTDKDGVQAAMLLNGKEVKGRALTVTSKKPRPEKRPRDKRGDPSYPYDRRGPRSAPPYYPAPYGARPPYGAPGRGGYYGMAGHMDARAGGGRHPPPMPLDHVRLQSRYDPYRRPDFYDPYMMPRGMPSSHPPPPPQYYHHPDSSKYGPSSAHHSRTSQPPQRYSNPFNRR